MQQCASGLYHLIPLDNEHFHLRSAPTGDEARLDIKAGGFWRRGQNAFFDIRITHINSTSNRNLPTEEIFRRNEAEKKRNYMERVIEIEHSTFTPLVFGTNGGMGRECGLFIKNLATKLAVKENEQYSDVITSLRTKLFFCILRAALLCVRGSRTPWRKNYRMKQEETDFALLNKEADIFKIIFLLILFIYLFF